MTNTSKWIVAAVGVLLIGGLAWWYLGGRAVNPEKGEYGASASPSSSAAAADNSDAALASDTASIDAQMNALASDSANVDQGLNDQAVPQAQ